MSVSGNSGAMAAFAAACLIALAALAGLAASCSGAAAYTFLDLYSFCPLAGCADGSQPTASLAVANASDIFGATTGGGANGFGVIFELTPAGNKPGWRESVVYELCRAPDCKDGSGVANVTAAGPDTLYVAMGGGGNHCAADAALGCGVVLQLTRGASGVWTRTKLYDFCRLSNCADGAAPQGQILVVNAGPQTQLYGLTAQGGAYGGGTLYSLQSNNGVWTESVIYSFCRLSGCADGANPQGQLVRDAAGAFYGVTTNGGAHNRGEVFKLTAGSGGALYSFCPNGNSCSDGAAPVGGVTFDANGAIYGVTRDGGANGEGAAFQLQQVNGLWSPATIYSFCSRGAYCLDGLKPPSNVIWDAGALVGISPNASTNANYEGGIAYRLSFDGVKWNLNILHLFCTLDNCADGASPTARLAVDAAGNLFGVTPGGGGHLNGAVFELAR